MFKILKFNSWGLLLGHLFEHYDTALYALLSPFFAKLFFPNSDPYVALLLAYAIIPLSMLAKPLGAVVLGRIGDNVGRRQAVSISFIGMGLTSFALACLPSYVQLGVFAPLLLCLMRLFQNFFSAGESMGGAIYLLESGKESSRDMLSGLYNAASVVGILLASFAVSLLYHFEALELGWRVLYFLGSITSIFAYFLRGSFVDQVPLREKLSLQKWLCEMWMLRYSIATVAILGGFSYSCYMIALVLMNGFIPLVTESSEMAVIHVNTWLLGLDCLTLPIFGWLATKYSRYSVMATAVLCAIIFGPVGFYLLEGATLGVWVAVRIVFVLIGVAFSAPLQAACLELVSKENRYAALSIGYAIGAQIFGGPTAAVSLWLYKSTGNLAMTSLYWTALACLTIGVLNIVWKKEQIFFAK